MTLQEQRALERRIAANLIYEAKLKEFEAAGWIDLGSNIEEARATVHSALDAVLDATTAQISSVKAAHRGAA